MVTTDGTQEGVRTNGTLVLNQLKLCEEVYGADVVSRAFDRLSDRPRQELGSLLPTTWVLTGLTEDLHKALAAELGRDPLELHRELTRLGLERTFKTFWRMLLRFTSDAALVSRTPLIYSKSYDRGEMTSRITEPGRAEIRLTGWRAPSPMQLVGMSTAVETVLRLAGRRDVKVLHERRLDGARFLATWRP